MRRRIYDVLLNEHLADNRQMTFVSGPRQVGKTTTCRAAADKFPEHFYLNWDNRDHRQVILGGPESIAEHVELSRLREQPPVLVLDEIHKWRGPA